MKVPFFEGEIIKSSSLVFLASFSASIITLFSNLMIYNLLGSEYFGNFRTVIYLFAFLPTVIDLGINATLTKYVAEIRESNKLSYLIKWFLKIKALSFVFLATIAFLLKDYIALYFLGSSSLSYLVVAGTIFAISSFFLTFSFITLGFQNFKIFSLSQFLNSSLSAVLAFLFSPWGVFYAILGWSLGPIIGNIPNILFILKKISWKHREIDTKKIFFKFSLPIFPIELSVSLINAIIPFLSLFFSQKLIGYYSFAFMFYLGALLVPNSLSVILFPKISELNGLKRYKDAKNILRKSFIYYTPFAFSGLLFVVFFSEWFISVVSKDSLPSLSIFNVIVSLGFIFGFNVIYTNYLKGLGNVKKYAFFTLVQNILLIAISFILMNFL